MNYIFILIIIAVTILEIVGDIFFKEWVIHHKYILIILGILFYFISTFVWAYSLNFQDLSKAIVIFAVLTLIVGVLVGKFIYKEEITSLQMLGIVLGLTSIILIEV